MRIPVLLSLVLAAGVANVAAQESAEQRPAVKIEFPFNDGDRVLCVGSSSTKIGIWCQTLAFLLRTRHPDKSLVFHRASTVKFGDALKPDHPMPAILDEQEISVIVFNTGWHDAGGSLNVFKSTMAECVEMVKKKGVQPILMPHQGNNARRMQYAEAMLEFGREKGYPVVDTYHPTNKLRDALDAQDPPVKLYGDGIHLIRPGYVAWGFFLWRELDPPDRSSAAELTADGKVVSTARCKIEHATKTETGLTFVRKDELLPILPPGDLPPRSVVPLEEFSDYRLKVTGLPEGRYEVLCEGKAIGTATSEALAAGVNLNTLLLDSGNPAPWSNLAERLWKESFIPKFDGTPHPLRKDGETDPVGRTEWRFDVRRK